MLVNYSGTTNKVRTFDLYISTELDVFKVETAVITNGSFVIERSRPLSLTVSGEASKLSKFTGAIPGTLQNTSITTSTYIVPKISILTIGGTDISDATTSLSVELQNDGEWNRYTTLHGALAATNVATSMYPSNFTIGTRVLGGSISKYLKSESDLLDWSMNTPLRLKVGTTGTFYGLDFNISNASFTKRTKDGDLFGEEYNWRMIQNPTALSSVLTYTTL